MSDQSQDAAAPAGALGPELLATLQQANQLMAGGQPGQAAPLFAKLAAQMEASNHPSRAANLHARAAHAFADGGAGQAALGQARSALNLFISNGMSFRTPMFYSNITRKMNNRGMQSAAAALQKEYGGRLGTGVARPGMARRAAQASRRGTLPTNCPKCGGPVHSQEASWVDDNTAECDYCGALIRAEA